MSITVPVFADRQAQDRWWVCERKHRYLSQAVAQNFATLLGWLSGDVLEAYPCQYCDDWHVGHPRVVRAA